MSTGQVVTLPSTTVEQILTLTFDQFMARLSPDIASQLMAKSGSKRKSSSSHGTVDSPGSKRVRSESLSLRLLSLLLTDVTPP